MTFSLLKILIGFLSFTISNSQYISMTVCSDNSCSLSCKEWMTTNYQCSICDRSSSCSETNPSSVTTLDTFSLYSDSLCNKNAIIPNLNNMPININSQCNILYSNNGNAIGSYKAVNISLVFGVVFSVLFILLLTCCCCWYSYKQKILRNQRTNANSVIVLESQSTYPQIIYPQPQISYPQPQISSLHQTHPQISYPQPQSNYTPTFYPQTYNTQNFYPQQQTLYSKVPPEPSAPPA